MSPKPPEDANGAIFDEDENVGPEVDYQDDGPEEGSEDNSPESAPAPQDAEVDAVDLGTDTLVGDITSFLVDRLRNWAVPFAKMNEAEQETAINEARGAARNLVEKSVRLIASEGKDAIPIVVNKLVNDGKGLKIEVVANREDEHRLALLDAVGRSAMLTVIDSEKFGAEDETAGPDAEPDQPDMLPGDTGSDETA